MMATRLRRATFAELPPPFFRCLAGIAAEKVGSVPIDIISEYEVHMRSSRKQEARSILMVVVESS